MDRRFTLDYTSLSDVWSGLHMPLNHIRPLYNKPILARIVPANLALFPSIITCNHQYFVVFANLHL
jgi:hypothetical protein